MAIIYREHRHVEGVDATIYVPQSELAAFKELVQRATNLWPDAPNEIKVFADKVTNGEVMQDYDKFYQPMSQTTGVTK